MLHPLNDLVYKAKFRECWKDIMVSPSKPNHSRVASQQQSRKYFIFLQRIPIPIPNHRPRIESNSNWIQERRKQRYCVNVNIGSCAVRCMVCVCVCHKSKMNLLAAKILQKKGKKKTKKRSETKQFTNGMNGECMQQHYCWYSSVRLAMNRIEKKTKNSCVVNWTGGTTKNRPTAPISVAFVRFFCFVPFFLCFVVGAREMCTALTTVWWKAKTAVGKEEEEEKKKKKKIYVTHQYWMDHKICEYKPLVWLCFCVERATVKLLWLKYTTATAAAILAAVCSMFMFDVIANSVCVCVHVYVCLCALFSASLSCQSVDVHTLFDKWPHSLCWTVMFSYLIITCT